MPRQNRVTPFGEIVAVPERGTLMGNRGILRTAPMPPTILMPEFAAVRPAAPGSPACWSFAAGAIRS